MARRGGGRSTAGGRGYVKRAGNKGGTGIQWRGGAINPTGSGMLPGFQGLASTTNGGKASARRGR